MPSPLTLRLHSPAFRPAAAAAMLPTWTKRLHASLELFVPAQLDAEYRRRAFLFIAFSLQGVFFGLLFAGFYAAIGHWWGAIIVLVCTLAMAFAPWIVRGAGLEVAGNIYAGVLTLGFTGLTAIEGGIHGHAVAWLAVVPLCASILVNQRMGRVWCAVCVCLMAGFAALDLYGVEMHPFYSPRWESTITAAGYLTLTFFMGMIGVFFERGRRHSLYKLHAVLDDLSAANTRLNVLDQERAAFLGVAAHDLRSPLNAIMGFAQLLQRFSTSDDPLQTDSIERIITASTRMRDLLDRFLSAEAIEEGKIKLRREPCDLGMLASVVVESQRANAAAKSIVLIFQPQDGLEATVRADTEATIQIIENLLSNAIKFSPPGRPVTVRVVPGGATGHDLAKNGSNSHDHGDGRAAEGVRVEVQDSGPGLSEEDQKQLYGRFAKLSARPTAGEVSNGLGLSIVKRLAEAMDGQIACRSRLGEGATFSLTLPRTDERMAAVEPRQAAAL